MGKRRPGNDGLEHATEDFWLRFWPKVDIRGPDECWLWKASIASHGYGQITLGRRPRLAHRVAARFGGLDPTGKHVLHTCDVRACVNPAHHYVGDDWDNAHDRLKRGKQPQGEKIHNSILTEDDVRDIRRRYRDTDVTQKDLATEFQVSHSTISAVIHRQNWKHVD